MRVGIGLPAAVPQTKGDLILEWARNAEGRGFSSVALIDRISYPVLDPLIVLAAVASVTSTISLMTSVLVTPLRNTAILIRQIAGVQALSDGRLILGVGAGGRHADFSIAGIRFEERGQILDRQLAKLSDYPRRRPLTEDKEGERLVVAHRPPELLVGGYSAATVRRIAAFADGYIAGSTADTSASADMYRRVKQGWVLDGRPGRPRFVRAAYYALGAAERNLAETYLRDYYAFLGDDPLSQVILLSSPDAIRTYITESREAMVDEAVLWPCVAQLEQLHRLAEVTHDLGLLAQTPNGDS